MTCLRADPDPALMSERARRSAVRPRSITLRPDQRARDLPWEALTLGEERGLIHTAASVDDPQDVLCRIARGRSHSLRRLIRARDALLYPREVRELDLERAQSPGSLEAISSGAGVITDDGLLRAAA